MTQKLIAAVAEVNRSRMDFIADQIIERHPKVVRIYRLVIKEGSPIFASPRSMASQSGSRQRGVDIIDD